MNKEEYFLDLYNKLDEYLRIKYFNNHSAYTSYVKKIFYIKNHKMNPIIENNHNFDLLKKAGEIRNIIAHNNDIIIPSDSFLEEFETLVKEIMKPKKVYQIMTKYSDLQTRDINDSLEDTIYLIKQEGYSSIPVLDHGSVYGMFTEKSIFDYLSMKNNYEINKSMPLSIIKDAINLDNNPRQYFKYIPRNMTVYEAYEVFSEDFKAKRELVLLLVSETGKSSEKILGIVALRDLKNLLYK